MFQIKVVENKISCKKLSGYTCPSPPQEWSYGVPKIAMFEILQCTEIGKQIHFRTQCCQKYGLYEKMLQMKLVEN